MGIEVREDEASSPRPLLQPRPGPPTDRTPRPADGSTLDVVSVPAGHLYPQRLCPADAATGPGFRLRPDPDPDDPSRAAGARWWPPVALDPSWLRRQRYDVLHLHFGLDDAAPQTLREVLATAHGAGVPVVLTVHDLRSPHQADRRRLDDQLDVLVPDVDAVLTLTPGAAAEIARRWGREALVVPHPHVADLATMRRLRDARRSAAPARRLVGVSVKSLRTNTDPLRLLPALERAVAARDDADLVVDAHHDLRGRDDAGARELVAWLDAAPGRGTTVLWHEPWSDADLWAHLARLHVAVLPYRWGTHSGWLELCHDLGTRVLAPSTGHYRDQGADGVFEADEHRLDEPGLERALATLLAADPQVLAGAEADERDREQRTVAATHVALYRRLVVARRTTSVVAS